MQTTIIKKTINLNCIDIDCPLQTAILRAYPLSLAQTKEIIAYFFSYHFGKLMFGNELEMQAEVEFNAFRNDAAYGIF